MNYVIGNNAVSYFLAYLLENTTLILHKTLEELDYNAGQKIIPNSTGIYIASDGYIRKLIYITKK